MPGQPRLATDGGGCNGRDGEREHAARKLHLNLRSVVTLRENNRPLRCAAAVVAIYPANTVLLPAEGYPTGRPVVSAPMSAGRD